MYKSQNLKKEHWDLGTKGTGNWEQKDTLWAENKTHGDSPAGIDSFVAPGSCCWSSADPFEKWGGEDVGKDEPDEKATGWGVAGDVRKGTAAGRTGDVNTGGPGGVLRWGTGLPVLTPFSGDSIIGFFIGGEAIWSCCKFGGVNLGAPGEIVGGAGVIGLFLSVLVAPGEACDGVAIAIELKAFS